ncbi:amino acid adenylation domain protein [Rhodococcus sp. MTM3W5.2]|nr:amino acid adenylation domain protein [Rhodococcus sp. MTM3W5.2]
MVPSLILALDTVPLTPAGKVDRAALPDPDFRSGAVSFRAPSTAAEQVIADAVAAVLHVDAVGVDESFFAMGGDSIIAIQLVSRVKAAGLLITPREVFERKTVAALAEVARRADDEQRVRLEELPGGGVGPLPMTPIARGVLERGGDIDRFYQAVALTAPADLDEERLRRVVAAVLDHHDLLRSRLDGGDLVVAPAGTVVSEGLVTRVRTAARPGSEEFDAEVAAQCEAAVGRLDASAGVMLQVVWVDSDSVPGRILVVAHHLVIDGVSWRILVPDFAVAWEQVSAGQAPALAPVETSARRWAHGLTEVSARPELLEELGAWRRILDAPTPLLGSRPLDSTVDTGATVRRVPVELSPEVTATLLTTLPTIYRGGVNDGLLTALGLAVAAWRRGADGDGTSLLLALEGHGREEDLLAGADLSRTVGWFTTSYPVRIGLDGVDVDDALTGGPAAGRAIKAVKEQLRTVPGSGAGFGLLRYQREDTGAELAQLPAPQVGFNYLGRIGTAELPAELRERGWIPVDDAGLNDGSGAGMPVSVALDINAVVSDGSAGEQLSATFAFPSGVLTESEVSALAALWRTALEGLAAHARSASAGGLTPYDVPLVAVDQAQIEAWERSSGALEDIWSLAPLQSGLLFHAGLMADSVDVYTGQIVLDLGGEVDAARFGRAAQRLLERHAALRAGFVYDADGTPAQLVRATVVVPWHQEDCAAEVFGDRVRAVAEAQRLEAFDMAAAPLLRFVLVRSDARASLVITNHHILFDGWSMPLFVKDLLVLYATDAPLPIPARPYRRHLEWLAARDREGAVAAWSRALEGATEPTRLAQGRPEALSTPLEVDVPVPAELAGEVAALARGCGVTVNTVIQAAWGIMLSRYLSREDIVFGATVSGRPAELPGVEETLGLFINTIPVRLRLRDTDTVATLLDRLQSEQARLLEHHHLGITEIQAATGIGVDFDTLTVFESYPIDRAGFDETTDIAGMRVRGIDVADATHYPVTLVTVLEPTLRLTLEYAPDVFAGDEIDRMSGRLAGVLAAMTSDAGLAVRDLSLLTAGERELTVRAWNDTDRDHDDATLPLLLDAAAARRPDAAALTFAGHTATFAEFDADVNRLARWLISRGVGPESVVGVAMHRSSEQIVAIHAVVRAGGAYLPIDPQHPESRTSYVLDNAAPALVLTAGETLQGAAPVVSLADLDLSGLDPSPIVDGERTAPLRADHRAYVLYTSGSTGRPKGVAVTHRAIVNRLRWMQDSYPIDGRDVVVQKTPATFDVSVWELFWPLVTGARLVVAEPDGHRDPGYLSALIREEGVTTAHFVPSMLEVFLEHGDTAACGSLRQVFASGEALPRTAVVRFHERLDAHLHNLYGPTEAAVDVTFHETDPATPGPVPIGAPVWNTRVYVLDARLRPAPIGVAGELYLAGVQLARGYVGRPDLTADRFVANPFTPGERMYRTGDLVHWNTAGELEYLGRTDFQVKLRGQRLELGEIEAVLQSAPGVGSAAVVVLGTGETARLVGYVTTSGTEQPDLDAVAAHAAAELPSYMVPSSFVPLDAMPLGPTGKLDRRALPEPALAAAAFEEPRTPAERAVARIFAEVLDRERVGATDGYVELGGNSLTATRVVARVNAEFGISLGVRELFDAPTVRALAAAATAARPDTALPELVAGERPDQLPLSPAQHRMWLLNRFDAASGAYNIAVALRLSGDLDPAALAAAVADVVDRHEVLRTVYPDTGHGPRQAIRPAAESIPDLTPRPIDPDELTAAVTALVAAGFDVTAEVPLRAQLLRVTERDHVLVLVVHHIAADGWSMRPLARDVMAAYVARAQGLPPGWSPLPVQYADYALWKHEALGAEGDPSSRAAGQLVYWTGALAGLPERLELPTDRPHPTVASHRGATVDVTIDPEIHTAVTELARSHRATPFMVWHAALAVLLARLSGTADIAIGTPVAGRGEQGLDDLVGMFVGTLVLRTPVDAGAAFTDLLGACRDTDLDAYAHADLPFERLVEVLAPTRSTAHHPLFQVVLSTDDVAETSLELPGITATALPLDAAIAKFDLHVAVAGDRVTWTYATDLFDADTVAGLADRLGRILRAVATDPSAVVGDIDLRNESERAVPTAAAAIPTRTLPQILRDAVAAAGGGTALVGADGALSYRELDARSDRLARALIGRGVGPETVVAMAVPRSERSVLAVWAIAKTGAAFVPVDPTYPADRIAHMLADSGANLGLTDAGTVDALPVTVDWLRVEDHADGGSPALSGAPITDADRTAPLRAHHPAYVIYTSGSTGVPKGVVVTHAGLAALAAEQVQRYRLDNTSRTLHFASPSFDASILELLMAVGAGAAMTVVPSGVYGGGELAAVMRETGVTHAFVTPAALATLDPAELPDVHTVIVGGEACDPALVRRWAPGRRMFNAYGPTESTVMATLSGPMSSGDPVRIGGPIRGTTALILDTRLHPVPGGAIGELYLAGDALARGYRGRAGLTAERFVADPHGSGTRLYRTGDLARLARSGELEYLGRSDHQVKVRGFRIELGEIDAALSSHTDVEFAVTVAHRAESGTTVLVAYVTAARELDTRGLLAHVGRLLPAYMVPAVVTVLDEIPTTPAGKVDRRALPEPVFDAAPHLEPRSAAERLVAGVVAEVLGADRVGALDDFFALGGTSLSATRVIGRLNETAGTALAVRTLFEAPTVDALAAALEAAERTDRPALAAGPRPERIPLSPAQSRMWILNRYDPESVAYNIPLVLRLTGELDSDALGAAVRDVLERHEALRTVFPEDADGPVQLVLAADETPLVLTPSFVGDEAGLRAAVLAELSGGFDVTTSIPLRGSLFRLSDTEHVLAVVVHHIAADGASLAPLARDLVAAYTARAAGSKPQWAPLPVQYPDYGLWQHRLLGEEADPASRAGEQARYWRDRLAGAPELLELPTDRSRPVVASLRGDTTALPLDVELTAALAALGRERGATLFMVVHAALAVLLARLGATDDVVVGTPIAGRGERALDDLVGMFVGTLALRARVDHGRGFEDLLERVREGDLAAYENADLPFERLIDLLQPVRSQAYAPIFQVALSQEQDGLTELALPGLTIAAEDLGIVPAKFDLQLTLRSEAGAELPTAIVWTYATDLFDRATVDTFASMLGRILRAVVADPSAVVGDIDLLGDSGAADVAALSGPRAVAARTLPEIVTAGVGRGGTALVSVAGEMSYAELDGRSNRLGRALIARGAGPETVVAIALPRTADAVVAMWAVAKTGAAFVPVDPTYPAERIEHMLTDSGADLGLTDRATVTGLTDTDTAPGLPGSVHWVPVTDAQGESDAPIADADRIRPLRAEHPAYLIYTSGSTGMPKGVTVTHTGLAAFTADARPELGTSASSRVLRLSSASFDASLFEMIQAFSAGATMVVVPPEVTGGDELTELMRAQRVSHVLTAPAAMTTVDPSVLPDLRTVVVGGEVCPPQLVERFGPGRRFVNSYGPTETTIVVTMGAALSPATRSPSAHRSTAPRLWCWTRGCGRCLPVSRVSCTCRAPGWPAAITAAQL